MHNNAFITLQPSRQLSTSGLEANEEIVSILDLLCHEIELPPSRVADAKSRYETIGRTLAGSSSALSPFEPRIFAQGSIALGTPVKPLQTHEFDVDLACAFNRRPAETAEGVRRSVYDTLNNNGTYKGKVRLLARCVQLSYADEFHMDIMPCIPGFRGQFLVPDKRAGNWAPTDPEGYAKWYLECSKFVPMRVKKSELLENRETALSANAQIDPFPEWDGLRKRPLQRCTQLLKRHRDKMFYADNAKAPSSVIITTLVAHSYSRAVSNNNYDSTLNLLEDVIAGMPDFIEITMGPGNSPEYCVKNPTLSTENFASKWHVDSELPKNFFLWHARALESIRKLAKAAGEGLDNLGKMLGEDYGQESARATLRAFSDTAEKQRVAGNVKIIVGGGLGALRTQTIPNHTNFGR